MSSPTTSGSLPPISKQVEPEVVGENEEEEIKEVDSENEYEEVDEDFEENEDIDENADFESTLKSIKEKEEKEKEREGEITLDKLSDLRNRPEVVQQPEVIDDFIRNYLEMGKFAKTLEVFQSEWYEKETRGEIQDVEKVVPDVYLQNIHLQQKIREMEGNANVKKAKNSKKKKSGDKLKKERDYHKLHHNRIAQEKKGLIKDLRIMEKHVAKYEPVLFELQKKMDKSNKQKNLLQIKVDNLTRRVYELEGQLKDAQTAVKSKQAGRVEGKLTKKKSVKKKRKKKRSVSSSENAPFVLPKEKLRNPFMTEKIEPSSVELDEVGNLEGHTMSVSGLSIHPSREIAVSTSDDTTWKMWELTSGKLMMTGTGHKDWLSGSDFHPLGTHLVTSSGDSTVKVWDFSKQQCVQTLSSHTQAVWDCKFHYTGNIVASCSLDHSIRLWDINVAKSKLTLHGHKDSVNSIDFKPFSNIISSASGDRSISLFDPRVLGCVETLFGHDNSVLDVSFNLRGDTIISSDSEGKVILWDVRTLTELSAIEVTNYPVNTVAFDPSGQIFAVAADDCLIYLYNTQKLDEPVNVLRGHKDSVQSVIFKIDGKGLISSSSDNVVKIWSSVAPPPKK